MAAPADICKFRKTFARITLPMQPLPSRPEDRDESPFPCRVIPAAVVGPLGLVFTSSAIPLMGELWSWIARGTELPINEMRIASGCLAAGVLLIVAAAAFWWRRWRWAAATAIAGWMALVLGVPER
jgi:hypothetical protein